MSEFNNRTFRNPEDVVGDPANSFELLCQSAKVASPFSMLNQPGYRKAVVIEGAEAMSAAEAASWGLPPMSAASRISNYKYMVRLSDEWNEHMLLPNPCDPAVSTSRNTDLGVCHLMVVGSQDTQYGSRVSINVGDYVDIDLEKGNFLKNLQKARHAGMTARPTNTTSHGLSCRGTKNLRRNFGTMTAGALISPTQASFEAALRRDFGEISVTSYTRTAEKQVEAMSKLKFSELGQYRNGSLEDTAKALARWHNAKDAKDKELYYNNALTAASGIEPEKLPSHMTGLALDISTKGLSPEQVDRLRKVVRDLGGSVNLEPVYQNCWSQGGKGNPSEYGKGALKRMPPSSAAGKRGSTTPTPGQNNCYNEHMHIDWPATWVDPKAPTT